MPATRLADAVDVHDAAHAAAARLGSLDAPVLLRLPFSHFCRKAEWGLTYAGVPYRTLDVGLRGMRQVKRANPGERTVPVLVTGTTVIPGSHAILRWAEGRRADAAPRFYPPDARAEVEAWEAWADREIGPAVRREAYRVMATDPSPYARSLWAKWRLRAARPAFRRVRDYLKSDQHDAADAAFLPTAITRTADQLAATGSGLLFGATVTGADVATAALLEPLLAIARVRGLDKAPGWPEVAAFVKRVKPPRVRRTSKRPAREPDWVAFETLNGAAGVVPRALPVPRTV